MLQQVSIRKPDVQGQGQAQERERAVVAHGQAKHERQAHQAPGAWLLDIAHRVQQQSRRKQRREAAHVGRGRLHPKGGAAGQARSRKHG